MKKSIPKFIIVLPFIVLATTLVEAQTLTNGWDIRLLVSSPQGPNGCAFYNYEISNSWRSARPFIARTQDPDFGFFAWFDNRDFLATRCSDPRRTFCHVDLYAAILGADSLLTQPIRITMTASEWTGSSLVNALADDNAYYLVFSYPLDPTSPVNRLRFANIDPRGTINVQRELTINVYPLSYQLIRATMLPQGRISILALKSNLQTNQHNVVFMVIDTVGTIIQPEVSLLPIVVLGAVTATDQQGTTYMAYNEYGLSPYPPRLAAISPSGSLIYDVPLGGLSEYGSPKSIIFDEGRLHFGWMGVSEVYYGQRNAGDGQLISGVADRRISSGMFGATEVSLAIDDPRIQVVYEEATQGSSSYYIVQIDKRTGLPVGDSTLIWQDLYYVHSPSAFDHGRVSLLGKRRVNSNSYNQLIEVYSVPKVVAEPLQRGVRSAVHIYYPRRPRTFVYLAVMFNWQPGIRLSDGRILPINPADILFGYSNFILGSQMLQLDNSGHAQTTIFTPSEAPQGSSYFVVAVVYDPAATSPIIDFNTKQLTIPA